MESITHWITDYGYIGLFSLLMLGIVGLPIPDETLLTFAGYLVFKQQLELPFTILAAFLGSICGISLSYGLGRSLGLFLIHKYGSRVGITEEKMKHTLEWFDRVGKWSLPFGYFIPGVRHLTAYIAGASKLQLPMFALFAYTGGLIWSTTFILLGYYLGEGWQNISRQLEDKLMIAVGIVVAVAVGHYFFRRKKQQRAAGS